MKNKIRKEDGESCPLLFCYPIYKSPFSPCTHYRTEIQASQGVKMYKKYMEKCDILCKTPWGKCVDKSTPICYNILDHSGKGLRRGEKAKRLVVTNLWYFGVLDDGMKNRP